MICVNNTQKTDMFLKGKYLYFYVSLKQRSANQIIFIINMIYTVYQLFSSPESKAQVTFSNQDLSVVCRLRDRGRRRLQLFTCSSLSPKPFGSFYSNMAKSHCAKHP